MQPHNAIAYEMRMIKRKGCKRTQFYRIYRTTATWTREPLDATNKKLIDFNNKMENHSKNACAPLHSWNTKKATDIIFFFALLFVILWYYYLLCFYCCCLSSFHFHLSHIRTQMGSLDLCQIRHSFRFTVAHKLVKCYIFIEITHTYRRARTHTQNTRISSSKGNQKNVRVKSHNHQKSDFTTKLNCPTDELCIKRLQLTFKHLFIFQ